HRMPEPGSVTNWFALLRQGDDAAAGELWRRYFPQLVALARRWLDGLPRAAGDEEDAALSAFADFCHGVREGDHADLEGRDGLWKLLATLTVRRAVDRRRRERARKRGGDRLQDHAADLDHLAGREPPPDLAAQVAEETARLLGLLADPELQSLALC